MSKKKEALAETLLEYRLLKKSTYVAGGDDKGDRLGLVLSVHGTRQLLALNPGLDAVRRHGGQGRQRYAPVGA